MIMIFFFYKVNRLAAISEYLSVPSQILHAIKDRNIGPKFQWVHTRNIYGREENYLLNGSDHE